MKDYHHLCLYRIATMPNERVNQRESVGIFEWDNLRKLEGPQTWPKTSTLVEGLKELKPVVRSHLIYIDIDDN